MRVVHGDCNPRGPGLKFIHVPTNADGSHPGKAQRIDAGSFMLVEGFPALAAGAVHLLRHALADADQARGPDAPLPSGIPASRRGIHIGLRRRPHRGHVSAMAQRHGDGDRRERPMLDRAMVFARRRASSRSARTVSIEQNPLVPYAKTNDAFSGTFDRSTSRRRRVEAPLYLAGCPEADGTVGRHYDGKIDGPTLLSGLHAGRRTTHACACRSIRPLATKSSPDGISHAGSIVARPSTSARRGSTALFGQPADPRHEGLELDRRGACLAEEARALRRRAFPSRRSSMTPPGRPRSR